MNDDPEKKDEEPKKKKKKKPVKTDEDRGLDLDEIFTQAMNSPSESKKKDGPPDGQTKD